VDGNELASERNQVGWSLFDDQWVAHPQSSSSSISAVMRAAEPLTVLIDVSSRSRDTSPFRVLVRSSVWIQPRMTVSGFLI
jgi:hypothetical protein